MDIKKTFGNLYRPYKNVIGVLLIIVGVSLLTIGYVSGLSKYNWLLIVSLVIVIVGVLMQCIAMKGDSKY